jgi:hypothetical protein
MQKKHKTFELPKADEGWKYLSNFVGLKFNDEEKMRLWPAVKDLYIYSDMKGNETRIHRRADLGTFIKIALFERVDRPNLPVITPKKRI